MSNEPGTIRRIDIVTGMGAKSYEIGDFLYSRQIDHINREQLSFQGDPYDHYVGRDSDGYILFTVNCLTPCVVDYKY